MISLARALCYAMVLILRFWVQLIVVTFAPHAGMGLFYVCEKLLDRLAPPPAPDPTRDLRDVYLQPQYTD